jgi:hypothetical protein
LLNYASSKWGWPGCAVTADRPPSLFNRMFQIGPNFRVDSFELGQRVELAADEEGSRGMTARRRQRYPKLRLGVRDAVRRLAELEYGSTVVSFLSRDKGAPQFATVRACTRPFIGQSLGWPTDLLKVYRN